MVVALFSWSIDACIVNGWLLYRSIKTGSLSLLDFRREVAQQLLKQFGTPKRLSGRPHSCHVLKMKFAMTELTIGRSNYLHDIVDAKRAKEDAQ